MSGEFWAGRVPERMAGQVAKEPGVEDDILRGVRSQRAAWLDRMNGEQQTAAASFPAGGEAAVAESVKAASDVYAPVSGTVTDNNAALGDEPELVNTDPEESGWLFRLTLSDPTELDGLMDRAAYDAYVAGL